MTSEEIKERVLVRDVLQSHGVKIRRNMCSCPFHKDTNPSMAVYEKSVYCFSCHFSGDVFTLTQALDNCSFKEAFISLGGTYDKMSQNSRICSITKRELHKKEMERHKEEEKRFFKTLVKAMDICRSADEVFEPLSDDWCYLKNKEPYLLYSFDEKYLNGNEVNEVDVYRLSRTIIRKYLP